MVSRKSLLLVRALHGALSLISALAALLLLGVALFRDRPIAILEQEWLGRGWSLLSALMLMAFAWALAYRVFRGRACRTASRIAGSSFSLQATLLGLWFIILEPQFRIYLAEAFDKPLTENWIYFVSLIITTLGGALFLALGMWGLVHAVRRAKPRLQLAPMPDLALASQLKDHLKARRPAYAAKLLRLVLHRNPGDASASYNLAVCLILCGELSAPSDILKGLARSAELAAPARAALEELKPYRDADDLKLALGDPRPRYVMIGYAFAFFIAVILSSIYGEIVQDGLRQLKTYEFKYTYLSHFKVHYQDESDAADTISAAEEIFIEICRDLGVPPDFLQGKLIKIFVCRNKSEYLRLIPQSREWHGGSASWPDLEIYVYPHESMNSWLLPHEITHIVYGHYFNEDTLWLHEGIAQCEEAKFIFRDRETEGYFKIKEHFAPLRKDYIPFDEFIKLHRIPSGSSDDYIHLYYLQSFSFIYFLRQRFGEKDFRAFLAELGRGETVEKALITSHHGDFQSLDQLEALWKIFYTWD